MATITAALEGGTRVRLSNGRHDWSADEPAEAGGEDKGPTPYELLLGALAACTLITLSLYCRHKGIPLASVRATYAHDRIHARDCEDCDEGAGGFLDRVRSRVIIEADVDAAGRARLEQIVGRCPVHRTLENGIRMTDAVEFA
ncbi:MAG: OsmC family protein [Gemmatimonadota bacterium]